MTCDSFKEENVGLTVARVLWTTAAGAPTLGISPPLVPPGGSFDPNITTITNLEE